MLSPDTTYHRELLDKAHALLPILDKRVVIFLTGSDSIEAIDYIKQIDSVLIHEPPIIASNGFCETAGEAFLQAFGSRLSADKSGHAINQADIAVIPILSRGALAKLALGIQDTPVTRGVADILMRGGRVIAVRDYFDPSNLKTRNAGLHKNIAYNRMLMQYEKTLDSFGVTITDGEGFRDLLMRSLYPGVFYSETSKRRVITLEDVRHLSAGGSFEILHGMRITMLAEEFLVQKRIRVTRI